MDAYQNSDALLKVENVSKHYGGVIALNSVSLSIRSATIHGLLGENGAGKSTLVGLISGHITPSAGRVYFKGEPLLHVDVQSMERVGVFLVTQEPMIVDYLSVEENLLLGIWPKRRFGLVDRRELRRQANEMLFDTGISGKVRAGSLDAVARRKLNILRALFSGGQVIILDEPTAALTSKDRSDLFGFMRKLKDGGVTFVFISHYNEEILEICDAVSVLRDGNYAGGSSSVDTMSSRQLSELVLGHKLALFERNQRQFENTDLATVICDVHTNSLDVSEIRVHPGEILGVTGLPGSGAKELGRVLFGLHPASSGTIRFCGSAKKHKLPRSPARAFASGIAYLSDDRRKEGAVTQMSIKKNISLSESVAMARGLFLKFSDEQKLSDEYFQSLHIKAPSAEVTVDTLSGGNQQKVCLARVLATKPKLLILDEPTRGIDVGVKQEVLTIVDKLTEAGVAVIIVSTDLDELLRAVDRVLIFDSGRVQKQLIGKAITRDELRISA